MNRKFTAMLGAVVLSGAVLSSLVAAKPASADLFHKKRVHQPAYSRHRSSHYRYYRNGRWYSTYVAPKRGAYGDRDRDGIRNRWDRDRDNDGRRNKKDDHPNNPRKH